MVVYIHNSSFKPSLSDGIFVDLGKLTSITVRRTFNQKYPYPYSECLDLTGYSSDLYDYIKNSNRTHRKTDCFELCIQQLVIS